ncbi:MAG: general secretion pathway protein GspB, partial [Pseudomonadota bacterium]|nr:general secretion pathway protein GspB [Pseudomonadota bacterium]
EPVMAAAALPVRPQLVQPPRPAVEAASPALPVWPQIPSHLFQQLSASLRLDVHVFSDQPQKSFVLINMQKYRGGEKLQEGPQLDEITPEGVILSFRGQRFRLQAQ